ncbi:TetR/AcrR family transcriptional regulator [Halioglobus sp. Uisw_031]|uniref:TetR/AcrR family transcriptional regulator n=1 Tax=Halioglobus sp. Uisw_031 TaxID=3230977 RepID=UPI0039ECCDFA
MSQRMVYQTEETREKILVAAEALFIEKGFFDAQMKALAVAVGISRNSLYRYFQDKNDLGYAVLGVVFNRIESRFHLLLTDPVLNAGLCGREQLRIVLKTGFLNEDLRADFSFMAEFDAHFSGSRIPPDFQSRVGTSVSTSMWSRVGEIVATGIADGSIRQDFSQSALETLVLYSMKALQGHILLRRSALVGLSSDEVNQLVPNLITVLIDGLKPTEPQ